MTKSFPVFALLLVSLNSVAALAASECPNNGTVRMGVEPYDSQETLIPLYNKIGSLLADQIGCNVDILITTNFTSEIEAMRSGHLEVAQFGSLGYLLAHQVAHADAVAAFGDSDGKPITQYATLQTWVGSGVHSLQDLVGKAVAFSDPVSATGHLLPAYGLKKAGVDPYTGIRPLYAGSHAAAFEAMRNHKVAAAEMYGALKDLAIANGTYNATEFVEIWHSDPIPNDPLAVSTTLPPEFRAKLTHALQTLDLSHLSAAERKTIGAAGITQMVPQTDAAYDGLRDLVSVLNIDLAKLYQ
jgi:phosphonate transport system substrate-binding protein